MILAHLALIPFAVTFYISPSGDDTSIGDRARPLATLTAARDRIRTARQAGDRSAAKVILADGTWRLSEPLVLEACDKDVVWTAEHRGKAVISGAVVPVWRKTADGCLVADVPGSWEIPGFLHGTLRPESAADCPIGLYQDGKRLACARWPNGTERATTGYSFGTGARTNKWGRGTFESGDYEFKSPRLAAWAKEKDLWAAGSWAYLWAGLRSRVLAVDPVKGTFKVDNPPVSPYKFGASAPFFVLNAVCERDEPGEWTVDRTARQVTLKPVPSAKAPAEIACARTLVAATNLTGVTFEGLVFEKTRGTALAFAKCRQVTLAASVVRHAGSWGVDFQKSWNCAVRGCDLYDLGEGGVSMDGGDRRTLTKSGNVVDNNHIREYGKEFALYRPGVKLGGVGARATHNLIHHADHQAMSFTGNDHYLGFNVIHDVCRDTDDAGAIYTFARHDWSERGTVVEYNVIHMTGSQPRAKHVYGVYFDNHCSGNVCRGNIINRVPTGIWASGGHQTVVERNILINCDIPWARGNYGKPKTLPYLKAGKKGNLYKSLTANTNCPPDVLLAHYPEISKILDMEDAYLGQGALFTRLTDNCYVGCGYPMYRDWEVTGPYTTLSNNVEIAGDPGFVDYYGFDWRLKKDSPIRQALGGPDHFGKMGLYDDPLRVSKAVKFSPDVSPARPIGIEFQKPGVRIGLILKEKLPKGAEAFAHDFRFCSPEGANRILATAGMPPYGKWGEYEFSFTPDRDGTLELQFEGACGEKTIYDDVRAEGLEIPDGSFEDGSGWKVLYGRERYFPKDDLAALRFPDSNQDPPYGICGPTAGLEGLISPAAGDRMCIANRDWRLTRLVTMKKDVPVRVTFRARAYIPPEPSRKSLFLSSATVHSNNK